MKKFVLTVSSLVLAMAMVGCGSKGGDVETVTTESGAKLTTSDELEVMAFKGGFGSDLYEQAAEEYGAEKGISVTVVAESTIDEQFKPRMMEGDPPDLAFPGWRVDHWAAVADEEVMALDTVLGGQNWEGDKVWRDTFDPALLKLGQMDGKQYVMPYFYSVMGWWYDPDLFAEKGWEVPTNMVEMMALCQKIKADGMAPITFQGKYPDYMIAGMLQPWVISSGGMEAFTAMQNLEPGAWNSEAVVKAAKSIADLRAQEYFQRGATAMTHTEAQTEFINGNAAMIPCGTWLYSEMTESLKPGQRLAFMKPPVYVDGKGDPSAVMIKIEPWLIPARAKNQEHAVGLFKYMTSLEKAKQFVTEKGTFMAVKGSSEVELPEYLVGASEAFEASSAKWASQWKEWYPSFYEKVGTNVTLLLNGELTPEQFGVECEKAAEQTRNDPDVIKQKVS